MIGVLALQGAFLEHLAAFAALGVAAREVRSSPSFLPQRCSSLPGI
jgi:glutamine amidotransferase PdxT